MLRIVISYRTNITRNKIDILVDCLVQDLFFIVKVFGDLIYKVQGVSNYSCSSSSRWFLVSQVNSNWYLQKIFFNGRKDFLKVKLVNLKRKKVQ
jgi:hypothetical protein